MILELRTPQKNTGRYLHLFIAGLLLLPNYIDLMSTLSEMTNFNTKVSTYIYYGVLWVLLLASVRTILRSMTYKVFLGALVAVLFVCIQCLLFPQNSKFIWKMDIMGVFTFSPTTLLSVVPYILIGTAVADTEELQKYLHTTARIGVVMATLSYVIAVAKGYDIQYDDMENAYAVCVLVCILIVGYRKHDVYFIALGCFSLVLAGTRGPLMCTIVATVLCVVFREKNVAKLLLKVLAGVLLIILLQGNLLLTLAQWVSDGFSAIGITSLRIIDSIHDGALMDSSGRDTIANTIVLKIWEKPFVGHGAGGDRIAMLSDTYAHNIFLEMWVSYGLIVGTGILGWMGYWLARGTGSKNASLQAVTTALFCSVVIKLLLSSSYLYSKELFILLGICMAGCRAQRSDAQKREKG